MGGGDPARGLQVGVDDLPPRSADLPGADRLAVDQLGGDEHLAHRLADVVHGQHVGVLQPGQRARLAQQARAGVGVGAVGAQQLDGDPALELGIPRRPHQAHRAGPERLLEPIAAQLVVALVRLERDHRGDGLAAAGAGVEVGGQGRTFTSGERPGVEQRDQLVLARARTRRAGVAVRRLRTAERIHGRPSAPAAPSLTLANTRDSDRSNCEPR